MIVWQKVLDFLVIVVGITETEKMEKQCNSWTQDRFVEFYVERSQDPAWESTQKVPSLKTVDNNQQQQNFLPPKVGFQKVQSEKFFVSCVVA